MLDRTMDLASPRTEILSQIGRPLGMAWVPQPPALRPDLGADGLLPADGTGRLEDALVAMIGAAREMIVLCSFLLASDRLTEALEAAARRGVRVYTMLASEARLGQEREEDDFSRECRTQHEAMLRRLAPLVMIRSAGHYHAKTVLIDPKGAGAKGWLLTANLTDDALRRNEELGLRLTPPEVRAVFAELRHAIWERAEHRLRGTDFVPAKPLGAVEPPLPGAALVTSPPRRRIQDEALALIAGARERIIVSSFGWALDHPVTQALIARARAGAQVTVLARIRPAAMPALAALAEAGATVHGFRWLHAKAIWTDGDRGMIMTANIEKHGMDEGFELGVQLEGARAHDLRLILEGWAMTAPQRLDPAAAIAEGVDAVQQWRGGALTELKIPARRSLDLGAAPMRSLTDAPPERPATPPDLPLAREVVLSWRIEPPRLAAKSIRIDETGKEIVKDRKDKTPDAWPALFREPSGRRVVAAADPGQLAAAASLADKTRAKAVVLTRGAK